MKHKLIQGAISLWWWANLMVYSWGKEESHPRCCPFISSKARQAPENGGSTEQLLQCTSHKTRSGNYCLRNLRWGNRATTFRELKTVCDAWTTKTYRIPYRIFNHLQSYATIFTFYPLKIGDIYEYKKNKNNQQEHCGCFCLNFFSFLSKFNYVFSLSF